MTPRYQCRLVPQNIYRLRSNFPNYLLSRLMIIRLVFLALCQITVVLAQQVLASPITSMTTHLTNRDLKTGYRWDTWQSDMSFSLGDDIVSTIKPGDYFDFNIMGSYLFSPLITIKYNFFIKGENN